MLITREDFEEIFEGYYITDCVVRNNNFLHLMLADRKQAEEADVFSETEVNKREVGLYLNKKGNDMLSYQDLQGFNALYIGATQDNEGSEVIGIDLTRHVYARGHGREAIEQEVPKNIHFGIVLRARMIKGRLYIIGSHNSVSFRKGVDSWESIRYNLPEIPEKDYKSVKKFNFYDLVDIDGFDYDNLYAIGRKGYVWYFNGSEWTKVAAFEKMYLESICCAGDGYVYIGGQCGTVFKGCGDKWEMIYEGNFTLPFRDMVWYDGKVWCTSDYGVWVVEEDKIVSANLPDEINVCAGHLSAADGVMLLAGMFGAAYHDGKEWHLIFNIH